MCQNAAPDQWLTVSYCCSGLHTNCVFPPNLQFRVPVLHRVNQLAWMMLSKREGIVTAQDDTVLPHRGDKVLQSFLIMNERVRVDLSNILPVNAQGASN